jgi:two-component system cell cycle sensor histidine kinase/response regulator CckA
MFWLYFIALFPVVSLLFLFLYDLAVSGPSDSVPRTILLVDDDRKVCELIGKRLKQRGFTVLSVMDGETALIVADAYAQQIDLLIADVVMPRMSGPQLAERVKATRPNMPVLFMSGLVREASIPQWSAPGAAFLEKPVQFETLMETMSHLLESRRCAA